MKLYLLSADLMEMLSDVFSYIGVVQSITVIECDNNMTQQLYYKIALKAFYLKIRFMTRYVETLNVLHWGQL